MAGTTRRGFFGLAGAGAAAAAAAAVVRPRSAAAPAPAADEEPDEPFAGSLVAWVRDARTGEVAVMVDEREVVVHDRALASRIARAAARTDV